MNMTENLVAPKEWGEIPHLGDIKDSAEKGFADAQAMLGIMFEHGINGVEMDLMAAIYWYNEANKNGHGSAWVWAEKLTQKIDKFKSVKLVADQGNRKAQYDLGVMYRDGLGVEKNYAEALSYFGKAVQQGYFHVRDQTKECFADRASESLQTWDKLMEKMKKIAVFEQKKLLAEQGNSRAQFLLGVFYEKGTYGIQDKTKALHWYTKSLESCGEIEREFIEKDVERLKQELISTEKEGKSAKQNDPTSPSHYKQGGIECIDAIRAMTSAMHGDGFKIACLKDVVKYVWRHEQKNGLEDLKKAQVYLNWAVEQMEKEKV